MCQWPVLIKYTSPRRQEIYGRDILQPRKLQNLGIQVHPSTVTVTISSFINTEHPLLGWPSARMLASVTQSLKHYKENCVANPCAGPSLSSAGVAEQLPRHWRGAWVRADFAPGCTLQGPGQLWEPSGSSTGSSHSTFQGRCSRRWSSTGPSGEHFSCSWSPDPESSQGGQAQNTQWGPPVPT